MGIGVIILASFVVIYGFESFYPSPQSQDYCLQNIYEFDTESSCNAVGGEWRSFGYSEDSEAPRGSCEQGMKCYEELNEAQEQRSRWIFIISIPLAILIIAIGAMVFSLEAVGAGLMGAAVVTLIYGAGGYWRYAENWLRFASSLVGLGVLIWFAYFFNKRFHKKEQSH